ncbi:odorant receptor 131-2-like [Gambusia affinis]|uniref:odorant receptor 131-2-like n=1 Tax=Gambusia affinis TaxID=33528 RepID=UPI001CDC7963|nr:odorant receptor 131-2-like [Gambusia affinis]
MSSVSRSNVSVELQYQEFVEVVTSFTLCTIISCVFLFINGTMLFTLRSKSVFRETCRYILLFNLLLADTVQLSLSMALFLLVVCRIKLTYPLCGSMTSLSNLTNVISPLTLMMMSLERCVAVCLPLRHAVIITIANIRMAIVALWVLSSLHNFTRIALLLDFPFEDLETLQMESFCSDFAMLLGPNSKDYDNAFTGFLFVSAGLIVISSYVCVIIAARSASEDKSSALKARNTLLLHLVQMCLSLSSTVYNPIIGPISKIIARVEFNRLQRFLYIVIIISPRCLSSLIYGLRDQTIRPVLLQNLCCRVKDVSARRC